MRVSYEWLKTMVDLPQDVDQLVAEYTRTGTEVEAVERAGAQLDHVVTGKVLAKEAHPDSDHLWVTRVDVGCAHVDEYGMPEPLQIVCGAQNFEVGDHIVCALEGAELPGGLRIKKSRLRGVDSYGMNCSARELGLSADHAGIMILPADAPVGVPVADYLKLSDTILDCEITPNRPDCLSMTGMARETGAILGNELHIELPRIAREGGVPTSDAVCVTVEDTGRCPRYVARVLRQVKIGPSPEWLARRVQAAGARSINNVVDITNYVMYLTGQPLHAFDLGKLSRGSDGRAHIAVRGAHTGEHLVTLDKNSRELQPDMTVITDDGKVPIALAGVMGGYDSEISAQTTEVLLESAAFSSGHTSRTSRNLQLISESSMRYERGVDASGCREVADIACALFEQVCGATVAPGAVDVYPEPAEPLRLTLRMPRLRAMMGAAIEDGFAVDALERLGCTVNSSAGDSVFEVDVPSFRPDLLREIDLYEEVARLWGLGDIEPTLPAARNHQGGLSARQRTERKVGAILRACGLNETINYNFVPETDLARVRMEGREGTGEAVRLMSPMSADMAVMRRSLIPGLLRNAAFNQAHSVANIALYETGRVFFGRAGRAQPKEKTYLAGLLAGSWDDKRWNTDPAPLDFFDAKGIVEQLFEQLRIHPVHYSVPEAGTAGFAQPGRAALISAQGRQLGWVAQIHPQVSADFDVEGAVAAFEIDLDALLDMSSSAIEYHDVATLPPVSFDLALVVDEGVSYETLMAVIGKAGGSQLESARLFDIYRDPVNVGANKKSMAFALRYRCADHTLTSEEAEAMHTRLVKKVCAATGAQVRGA